MTDIKAISLFDLNQRVREVIYDGIPSAVWIIAEISELNENRNGHCYLELVDKNPENDTIRAISRATIWASRYRMIKPYFETTTGQSLNAGIKVMLSVKVDFHERYGLSLNVIDIEPSFTLGEMARKRIEILQKLDKEGVLGMNKDFDLPTVPQKIAVISSETAAGYGDFIDQLKNNSAGYQFYTTLYPAVMQGNDAPSSIINALDRVAENESGFDLVVIIRGGGAKTDLSSFDDYNLAYYITQFPLPIISGIGHERDESVVDIVAHTSCKTPTAVAEFLIQLADYFWNELDELRQSIVETSREKLLNWKDQIKSTLQEMKSAGTSLLKNELMSLRETAIRGSSATGRYIHLQQIDLNNQKSKFNRSANRYLDHYKQNLTNNINLNKHLVTDLIKQEKQRLHLLNKEAEFHDPARILKKGYSITYHNGEIVKDGNQLNSGDQITTHIASGTLESEVKSWRQKK